MSRDWSPREMHHADFWAKKERGEYMHDIELVYRIGDEVMPMGCKKYPDLYEKYPNLCFLLGAEEVKKLNMDLSPIEAELTELIKADDEGRYVSDDNPLCLWYEGRLDPNFYYSEENNEYFCEYIRGRE